MDSLINPTYVSDENVVILLKTKDRLIRLLAVNFRARMNRVDGKVVSDVCKAFSLLSYFTVEQTQAFFTPNS